jgi:hypothetical protein
MPQKMATPWFTGLSLLAATILTALPCNADPTVAASPPCAAASGLNSVVSDPATAPADWTQKQVNEIPQGDEIRDRDAYRTQVTEFYQQHLAAYHREALRLDQDVALLNQFRLNSETARSAIIGGGGSVIDPNPPSLPATPVQIGTRDLTLLANKVAIDRAALAKSCDALEQDRMILERLRTNR